MKRGSSDRNSQHVIPPSKPEPTEGWILSDQLPRVPRQDLLPEEAEAFLEYLFSAVARRPRSLRLEDGARVARYLDALAWETEPGAIRQCLERLRDVIWGTLLRFAPFELSGKLEAIQFLERHADTYLAGLKVEAALKRVRESAPPSRHGALFPSPHLMSRSRSATGMGNPRLMADLSQRIYVGYHALRRAGLRNARRRVAEALNRQGLQTRARGETSREWSGYEVYERVKQCEARWKEENAGRKDAVEGRDAVVYAWIDGFRSGTPKSSGTEADDAETGGDGSGAVRLRAGDRRQER